MKIKNVEMVKGRNYIIIFRKDDGQYEASGKLILVDNERLLLENNIDSILISRIEWVLDITQKSNL